MKNRSAWNSAGLRLFGLSLPLLAIVFLFSYLPLYGWIYAFYDFHAGIPLSKSEFVGFEHFAELFDNPVVASEILRVLRNTFALSLLGILTSPLPALFAVFLLEIKSGKFRKVVQTLTTLPNYISWILVYTVAWSIFSVGDGFLNRLLLKLHAIDSEINFLASSDHVWLTMLGYSLWKGLGWSAIIYLAAIASIDHEQYEAATVDGAGRFQKMWHVTVPGIMPTFFVLLLLSIANFVNNGMEQYFIFQNPLNKDKIEVLDLYVYNQGMVGQSTSYATVVSMLKSLVSIALLFMANALSKLLRKESII